MNLDIPIPTDLLYKFNGIKFHDDIHKYYLGDKNLISVTTLLHEYQEPFNEQYWSEIKAVEYGMTSARQSIYNDPDVLKANPFFKGYSEALSVAKPFAFKVPQWIELFIPLGEGVSKYLSNETKDPKTALDEVAQKWTTSIEANKPSFEYKE